MPYLNPVVIPEPIAANYRGFCVYVPDLPEYRAALLGSLNFLETWVAWERDGARSASKSAELWKVANGLTKAHWDSDCSEDCMSFDCDTMKDCLIDIARAISVNVTVNNSCSTGGANTLYCVNDTGDITVNPPPVTDDPVTPVYPLPDGMTEPPVLDPLGTVPDNWETWEAYDQDACEAANALVSWAETALTRVDEMVTEDIYGLTAIFAFFVNAITGGWGVVFSAAMLLKLGELLRSIWDNTEWLTDVTTDALYYVQDNRQELVCELYQGRYDAGDWENVLINRIFTASEGGISQLNEKPLWLDTLKYLLPGFTSLNVLYGSLTYQGDTSGFLSCDCQQEPVWANYLMSTGYHGVSSLTITGDNENLIAGEVELWKSSQYGAFQFGMSLNVPSGLQEGQVEIDWLPTGHNPGWRVQFRDASDQLIAGLTTNFAAGGQYQIVPPSAGLLPAVRTVQLVRTDEVYNAGEPRIFTFSFSVDWVLL